MRAGDPGWSPAIARPREHPRAACPAARRSPSSTPRRTRGVFSMRSSTLRTPRRGGDDVARHLFGRRPAAPRHRDFDEAAVDEGREGRHVGVGVVSPAASAPSRSVAFRADSTGVDEPRGAGQDAQVDRTVRAVPRAVGEGGGLLRAVDRPRAVAAPPRSRRRRGRRAPRRAQRPAALAPPPRSRAPHVSASASGCQGSTASGHVDASSERSTTSGVTAGSSRLPRPRGSSRSVRWRSARPSVACGMSVGRHRHRNCSRMPARRCPSAARSRPPMRPRRRAPSGAGRPRPEPSRWRRRCRSLRRTRTRGIRPAAAWRRRTHRRASPLTEYT